jgi:hypothetical protein
LINCKCWSGWLVTDLETTQRPLHIVVLRYDFAWISKTRVLKNEND